MYGFNRYAPGSVPGATRFYRPNGGNLQLGMGSIADKIRSAIDANSQRGQAPGQAAGAAANAAARGAGPNAQFAGQAAMAPGRPMLPDGTPNYGLGGEMPGATQQIQPASPQARGQYGAAQMAGQRGAPMPGQAPAMGAPPGAPPPQYAPGQVPLGVDPAAMTADLERQMAAAGPAGVRPPEGMAPNISPSNYMAHEVGGKTVLLRNGADPQNPRAGDLLTNENGQWVPAQDDLGQQLYGQMHIGR